ncbi:MAG: hypothetical protein HY465_01270 [Deltaproteobacteria bacterium]|nr:hypothetical protein [Deltaproteobacteria bacterium]
MADVTITGKTCMISDDQLVDLRRRVRPWLMQGVDDAYSQLPIERAALVRDLENNFLTRNNMCTALNPQQQATVEDHNTLRDHYRGNGVEAAEARRLGIVVKTFDIPRGPAWCPANTSCEVMLDAFDDDALPAVMFATNMLDAQAKEALLNPSYGNFMSRYEHGAPVVCRERGATYHAIDVGVATLEFVTLSVVHDHWSTFSLQSTCTDAAGNQYQPDDLIVSFGLRVFVPVTVSIDGQEVSRTLIIDSVASEPSNAILRALIPTAMATRRFTATNIARKLFLDARAQGWSVR